ncbi:hypothetical protein GF382_01870, partial [Candidatus Falkowbacteria bacterium]|nr:hypothetical protein [Candidatus Falkowbacteria bacterium]
MDIFKEEKPKKHEWLLPALAIFFIFSLLTTASYFGFENAYKNRLYPKIRIAGIDLGGKTRAEAKDILNKVVQTINENGVKFTYQNNEAFIYPILSSFEGDIAFPIIAFDVDGSVEEAYSIGRKEGYFRNLFMKVNSLFRGYHLKIPIKTEGEEIKKILKDNFNHLEQKAQDAELTATTTWKSNWQKQIVFEIL